MTYRATPLGCLFITLALFCTGCEVWGVVEFATEQSVKPYVLLASACMALVAPALPEIAKWCRRSGHYVAWLAALGALVVCLSVVVGAAIQRTGTATDVAEARREQAKVAKIAAAKTEAEMEIAYKEAQSAALKECADGRRARCMDAETKATDLRNKLVGARTALVTASMEQSDPFAKRLSALLMGKVSEDQIRLLWPILIPVGISLLAAVMFSGWVRVDFSKPADVPQSPLRASDVPRPIPASNVVALPSPRKFGALAAYLVSRIEPAEGEMLEIEHAMYNDYKAWCEQVDCRPYAPNQFATELASVGKAAGLSIDIRGKRAYCVDIKLAS